MSEWYVFSEKGSSLRQRALYSDDCNRLQQTATDCNRLQLKEGSSLRQRALYSDEKESYTSSDDQSATDCNRKGPAIPPRTSHFPVSNLSTCISIHPCIYVCMCLCMYARMCVLMYSRMYASLCVSMYLCIYLSIYL